MIPYPPPEGVRQEMPPHPEFDVFLSYNRRDLAAVERLANALKDQSLAVWFDAEQLEPGSRIIDRLGEAILHSTAVAVLMGGTGH